MYINTVNYDNSDQRNNNTHNLLNIPNFVEIPNFFATVLAGDVSAVKSNTGQGRRKVLITGQATS